MSTHDLDLRSNALDSLNEALRQFASADASDPRAYKFAILHFSHFLELILKHHISQHHPLLIYKNPFAKNIEKEQTIGLWEAIQFLKNAGNPLDPDFILDLEWLKKLRNQIEHYRFSLDTKAVRRTMARLVQATVMFDEAVASLNIEAGIDPSVRGMFSTLSDEHAATLSAAKQDAAEEADEEGVRDCRICGESDVVTSSSQGAYCHYCEEVDELVECARCTNNFLQSECRLWDASHDPPLYMCDGCDAFLEHV